MTQDLQIVFLGEPGSHDRVRVGGKAAGLAPFCGRFPIPPGFCLPAGAEIEPAALAAAYAELSQRAGVEGDAVVAVRSSATDEDGAGSSFAGQYDTVLGVTGADAVAEAVQTCLASAREPRVVEYRRSRGLPDDVAVAVLVQLLVTADTSAVAFSVDPVSGASDVVVVNATWGLGESLVAGLVTPDAFRVDKASGVVIDRRLGDKATMTVPTPGGVTQVGVPRSLRGVACLDDAAVAATARLAVDLEAATGGPVDVECAWRDGRLWLLQCRPVTAL